MDTLEFPIARKSRAAVINSQKGIRNHRPEKISIAVLHHVRFRAAEKKIQQTLVAHQRQHSQQCGQKAHGEKKLLRREIGVLLILPPQILRGDNRAARGKR